MIGVRRFPHENSLGIMSLNKDQCLFYRVDIEINIF